MFFHQVLAEYANELLSFLRAWKEVDTALFTRTFSSIESKGNKLKSTMAPLFLGMSCSGSMLWKLPRLL